MSLAVLLALRECDVERLGDDDAAVHLGHGLRGLFRGGETDESESLGAAVFNHDAGGGDGAEVLELLSQTFVVDGVVQVLDKQVDALVSVHPLHLHHFELPLELGLSFGLLLSSSDEEGLSSHLLAVKIIAGGLGLLGLFETDEAEALALAILTGHYLKIGQLNIKI